MVVRSSKRISKNRSTGKILFFLIILILSGTSIFLLHTNRKLERELHILRRDSSALNSKIKELQTQLHQKDTELAELKIQAVIKDSESSH